MNSFSRRSLLAAASLALVASVVSIDSSFVKAASKGAAPAKVTYTGLSGTFRCSGTVAGGAPSTQCATQDRILGDGAAYVGDPANTAFGTFLYTSGTFDDLWFRLNGTGGRYVILDFISQAGGATCGSGCRKNFTFAQVASIQLAQGTLIRPVDSNGNALANGMDGLTAGVRVRASMLLNFPDPSGRKLYWTIRFNHASYSASNYIYVTRTGPDSWFVEAGPSDGDAANAVLVGSLDGTKSQTLEGVYNMPFAFTVTR